MLTEIQLKLYYFSWYGCTTLFKIPFHPLQSTTTPSSKYCTTLFKVPQNPLQSTTPLSSKEHTFNVNILPN